MTSRSNIKRKAEGDDEVKVTFSDKSDPNTTLDGGMSGLALTLDEGIWYE